MLFLVSCKISHKHRRHLRVFLPITLLVGPRLIFRINLVNLNGHVVTISTPVRSLLPHLKILLNCITSSLGFGRLKWGSANILLSDLAIILCCRSTTRNMYNRCLRYEGIKRSRLHLMPGVKYKVSNMTFIDEQTYYPTGFRTFAILNL